MLDKLLGSLYLDNCSTLYLSTLGVKAMKVAKQEVNTVWPEQALEKHVMDAIRTLMHEQGRSDSGQLQDICNIAMRWKQYQAAQHRFLKYLAQFPS